MIQFPHWVTHALGCQMWQITYVGILVWSSIHWVWADSSSSFNLSQMDLEPGAKAWNFPHWNTHLTYKLLNQGRTSCYASEHHDQMAYEKQSINEQV